MIFSIKIFTCKKPLVFFYLLFHEAKGHCCTKHLPFSHYFVLQSEDLIVIATYQETEKRNVKIYLADLADVQDTPAISRFFDLGGKEHPILDSCFLDESKLSLLTITVLETLFSCF